MAAEPGHAHLPAIKILHLDYFPAPRQFVPRHCASARNKALCTLTTYLLRSNLYPRLRSASPGHGATRVMLKLNLYLDGKNCAVLSLHRDNFVAEEPGLCPDASRPNVPFGTGGRRVTLTELYPAWLTPVRQAPGRYI